MNFFRSKWMLLVTIPTIGGLIFAFLKIKLHENIVNEEMAELEGRVAELEKDNNFLERIVSQMTHPSFLEKEARLKLNYKVPGEEVVFVYPDNENSTVSVSHSIKKLENAPNYVKWAYYLMGY